MSEFAIVIKLLAGYLFGAYALGIISLALMWWSEGREVSIGDYFKEF